MEFKLCGASGTAVGAPASLRLRRMGIDTYQELVVYLRGDSQVCTSEGFEVKARLALQCGGQHVVATLNVVQAHLLDLDEIGLSEAAWRAFRCAEGDAVQVGHPAPPQSLSNVRAKIYERRLSADGAQAIVTDLMDGRYSDIELAAFITACSAGRLDVSETVALTRAMVGAGLRLKWDPRVVVDKHCVGGLPGNRTTLLVVPIAAACGLTIPKTSSRAIASPAGSADTMETLAPVALDIAQIRRVVDREGGCIVWSGAVALSPADDVLIRVERPLDLDGDGLLVASVLSRKIAAGANRVVIDIPVGGTAKVRSAVAAHALGRKLELVGEAMGIRVKVVLTDGSQPVGRGIGPALEAHDVLAVLRNETGAPGELRTRALALAASVLELGGKAPPGQCLALAREALDSGAAWRKFQGICDAQGGMRMPPRAPYTHALRARHCGRVTAIDNRVLARVAKLAGAPTSPSAGISFHAPLGAVMDRGQALMTLHAESRGELAYALAYAEAQEGLVTLQPL